MKVTVLGNGGFGTAMAIVALTRGHAVHMWGHDPEYTALVRSRRTNPRYLPRVTLPEAIAVTSDGGEALADAELVLVAVPTQHLRATLEPLVRELPPRATLISLAKGLEQETGLRPSQVLRAVCGDEHEIHVLSGPSHAEEVALLKPAAVVLAGDDMERAGALLDVLSTTTFRVYSNKDLLGVELAGALKNVMGVAAGIADGLGLGDNTKAAILSRGIVEMARFGIAEGALLETFFGLAGMGDLAVTAFSQHGRNLAFGRRIGQGETLEQILESTHKVAEGVWTSRVVCARAAELGVEMPLSAAVVAVLFDGVSPRDAVAQLMSRDRKDEVLR